MWLATLSQMAEIERRTAEDFLISDELLMEVAGSLCAREIQTSFLPELQRGRVGILCGPGNNGGDGLVLARHLLSLGFLGTEIILVGEKGSPLHDLQLDRAKRQQIKVARYEHPEQLVNFNLVVDAVFGIGLNRDLEGSYLEIIEKLNGGTVPVVSIDIPTGLDALSGKIYGACVRAQMTLTLGVGKPGLYSGPGAEYCGRIRIIPIGFPKTLLKEIAKTHLVINEAWVRRRLPLRKRSSHKLSFGRIFIRAGHSGTWGAAALCCNGAYRMGAGYVTLVTEEISDSAKSFVKEIGPEVLVTDQGNEKIFEAGATIVVGPGAGKTDELKSFIKKLIDKRIEKVVIDADALSLLAEMRQTDRHLNIPKTWVLTPHTGEMSRLLGTSASEIESARFVYAEKAAASLQCVVLLKGDRTLVVNPEGHVAIVASGNAALAKAGTGDVLAGFIGALMAQGMSSFEAAAAGAFIHGRIADRWVKEAGNSRSLMASDLFNLVPQELNRIERA